LNASAVVAARAIPRLYTHMDMHWKVFAPTRPK
jgi:hypothetical protein